MTTCTANGKVSRHTFVGTPPWGGGLSNWPQFPLVGTALKRVAPTEGSPISRRLILLEVFQKEGQWYCSANPRLTDLDLEDIPLTKLLGERISYYLNHQPQE